MSVERDAAEVVPKRAATQDVHDIIRREILEGELAPGEEISQPELSKRLKVSRTPLREALRLLEREGLVVNNGPHRSLHVSPVSVVDLDELYALRVMGEALAIWLTVPTLRESDLEALQRNIDTMEDQRDLDIAQKAHRDFHSGLRTGCGIRLKDELDKLFQHSERYVRASARVHSEAIAEKLLEHREILAACRARDRTAARELMVNHVSSTAIELMEAESHAPFVLPLAIRMATEGRVSPVRI